MGTEIPRRTMWLTLWTFLRAIRVLAFIPLAPVYAVGYLLVGIMEDDDGPGWLESWPLELRLLAGYAAPFLFIGMLLMFAFLIVWEQMGGEHRWM